jgi:hypothetical protein
VRSARRAKVEGLEDLLRGTVSLGSGEESSWLPVAAGL